MAGFSDYIEPKLLDVVFNNTAVGAIANTYVKLHIGDPGDAGTANAAGNTTRKLASWAAASGGTIQTDASLDWTNVSNSEDYTHFSVWDDPTAGNCLFTGTLTANAVTAGDNFTIATGDIDITLD